MSRVLPIASLCIAACATSCLAETETETRPTTPVSRPAAVASVERPVLPPPRDDGRLPVTVIPVHYDLTFDVDPSKPRFSGRTLISVDVAAPTWDVVLDARDLTVASAKASLASGATVEASVTTRTAHGSIGPEELVLSFARPLPPGSARIVIEYSAPFGSELSGLYRVQEDGRWYAYTQFEATDARRAFPCFDEPSYKTPFDVRVVTPRDDIAVANSPESPFSGQDADHAHVFATTPPLPTYLVALAVGPFDIAEGARTPVPIRVITTHGRAGLTGLALDTADALLQRLTAYFDIRYPYAKLDLVAVPDFSAGAMENPGLVTFRDVLLLVDRDHATTSIKRGQAEVIAHEFAHQWFGDLVTMQWWDDLWLNEGFATWAAAKTVDAWRPTFGAVLEQIAGVQGVMDTDALQTARAVREPVRSTSEAREAFDGLTYDKGAAVLRMLESWVGPDTFRRGVQKYLLDNAWKNARAGDLFKAIDFVSAQSVAPLANAFLDQTGVPELMVSWTCSGPAAGKLELRQSEWRPLGEDRSGGPRTWILPVCVASDTQRAKTCFTVGADPMARSLGAACPSWVYPNADQAGYYRFVLDSRQLSALAGAGRSLDPAERLGLVSNAWAAVRQGAIEPSALLDILPTFDVETNRLVVDQVVGVLAGFDQALVDDAVRPAFRRYLAARLLPRKRALGWEDPKAPPTDDRALERRTVLWALGELASDEATLAEAERYAARWLHDPTSVPSDVAALAVPLASKRSIAARLGELREAAKRAVTPQDRAIALRAMGSFDDTAILRQALDLIFTEELKLSELRYVFNEAAGRRETRAFVYAWEKENWAKLRARMPGSFGSGMLIGVAGGGCAPAERDDARAFFGAAAAEMEGTKRTLDEALERAGLCIALRRAGADRVTAYFAHK